jgi:hypothetical protein
MHKVLSLYYVAQANLKINPLKVSDSFFIIISTLLLFFNFTLDFYQFIFFPHVF